MCTPPCHSVQGVFDLNALHVGKGAVMRRHTRLLSGASMEPFSVMLENTLVISGDVLGAGTVWQGWPANMVEQVAAKTTKDEDDPDQLAVCLDELERQMPGGIYALLELFRPFPTPPYLIRLYDV